ncbi:MAG: hypothetical protein ACOC90_05110 [Bacteroidota bacterium]
MKKERMKIGFIGSGEHVGHTAASLSEEGDIAVGVYHSGKTESTHNLKEYSGAESLIASSDLVYVAKDELPLFEICQIAIKETKHLCFESPFLLDHEAFRHLFHLARESKSILHLSQKWLVHPAYVTVRAQLDPLFIGFRVDVPEGSKRQDTLSSILFDMVSVIWDTINRDLRKMRYFPLEYNMPSYPGNFFLEMDFESGTHVNLLFNHLTDTEACQAEFIQTSRRFFLNFTTPELAVYDRINGGYEATPKGGSSERELLMEDFRNLLLNLNKYRIPLTINEDSQAVLSITHSILDEIRHKSRLLT